MLGFASYDEAEALFWPSVGFDVVGEFDHVGTNRFGLSVPGCSGAVSVGSLTGFPVGRVVVWGWSGLGEGRLPPWVVYLYIAERLGDPIGALSDETEPTLRFQHSAANAGPAAESARTRIGYFTNSGSSPGECPTRIRAGSALIAASRTSVRSATLFGDALPRRSTTASGSPVQSAKQYIGWNPYLRL